MNPDRRIEGAREREGERARERESEGARKRENERAKERENKRAREQEGERARGREGDRARERESERARWRLHLTCCDKHLRPDKTQYVFGEIKLLYCLIFLSYAYFPLLYFIFPPSTRVMP